MSDRWFSGWRQPAHERNPALLKNAFFRALWRSKEDPPDSQVVIRLDVIRGMMAAAMGLPGWDAFKARYLDPVENLPPTPGEEDEQWRLTIIDGE